MLTVQLPGSCRMRTLWPAERVRDSIRSADWDGLPLMTWMVVMVVTTSRPRARPYSRAHSTEAGFLRYASGSSGVLARDSQNSHASRGLISPRDRAPAPRWGRATAVPALTISVLTSDSRGL